MDVTELLARAAASGACDLHLATGRPPMLRLDAELRQMQPKPLSCDDLRLGLAPWLSETQHQQWLHGDELDIALAVAPVGRLRASLFRQAAGLAASFRLLPAQAPGLEALGLEEVFQAVSQWREGLVLVGGPTGSGKSSTLAALVDQLVRRHAVHVLTLEDPIEILHQSHKGLVTQREIGRDTRDFAQGLRSALRQDPDVLMIGELRDLESIRLALRAAQTGHLVLATVHTRSAVNSVDRLVEVFSGEERSTIRALLAESLRMVIAQTLVKRIGGGRIAAREVLVGTPAVRNLIREGRIAQLHSAIQSGATQGMRTMEEALRLLRVQGLVE